MQFSLENDIAASTRMDSSLAKPPSYVHKRKALEASNNSLNASLGLTAAAKFNLSMSNSVAGVAGGFLTGMDSGEASGGIKRHLENSMSRKTPSKTARRSPSRNGTPGKSPGRKTPGREGDRFIPNRSAIDMETSSHMLMRDTLKDPNAEEVMSPSKREYQRVMAENLGAADLNSTKVLAFQAKPPSAPEGHTNNNKIIYSATKNPTSSIKKKASRHIPQAPERILDAPDIRNDYYLSLVDWSSTGVLAVALGAHIYLWNNATGAISQLAELGGLDEYVCSVKWVSEGAYLAVGSSTGEVQLWDATAMKRSRTMRGLESRVASLSWNQWVLSGGSRAGQIQHSDVRVAEHQVGLVNGHQQEVCGLAWSPDGRTLASGGNDNVLNLWSAVAGGCHSEATPQFALSEHCAAVKAVAWCPWQSSILATGGGTADRCIKVWNASNGTQMSSTDTRSQVCSLVWAPEYKELVSSHGYPSNEVVIWRYPAMTRVAELMGHTERVLQTCLSPDTSTLVSAGADETLRLWKAFTPDPAKKKEQAKAKGAVSSLRMGIR